MSDEISALLAAKFEVEDLGFDERLRPIRAARADLAQAFLAQVGHPDAIASGHVIGEGFGGGGHGLLFTWCLCRRCIQAETPKANRTTSTLREARRIQSQFSQ